MLRLYQYNVKNASGKASADFLQAQCSNIVRKLFTEFLAQISSLTLKIQMFLSEASFCHIPSQSFEYWDKLRT